MRRIILVLSVAALMVAIMVTMAVPAFAAGGTPGKGVDPQCAKEAGQANKVFNGAGQYIPTWCPK
jgi:hypothetical protein